MWGRRIEEGSINEPYSQNSKGLKPFDIKWLFFSKEIKFLNYSANLSLFLTTSIVAMLLAMPSSGLEPETSPLPRECSTAELKGQF